MSDACASGSSRNRWFHIGVALLWPTLILAILSAVVVNPTLLPARLPVRQLTASQSTYGWTTQIQQPVSLSGISCPSSEDCFAVGSTIEATTTAGLAWIPQPEPAGVSSLSSVSCTSTSDCWAVGSSSSGYGIVVATTDGGSTWTTETIPSGTPSLVSISCLLASTTEDCWAVSDQGDIIATTDAGSTWSTQTTPTGVDELSSISCASPSDCWAVGQKESATAPDGSITAIIATSNGGTLWTNEVNSTDNTTLTDWSGADSISCVPGTTQCVAAVEGYQGNGSPTNGNTEFAVTTDGTTWTAEMPSTANGTYDSVFCASSSDCWGVGSDHNAASIQVTSDGGTSFQAQSILYGGTATPQQLSGVACANGSTSDCWIVGQSGTAAGRSAVIIATTDGGTSWDAQQTYPLSSEVNGISCTSASACWQAGGTSGGTVANTFDGGLTWSAEAPVLKTAANVNITSFAGIDCLAASSTTTDCWVVGSDANGNGVIEATTNGGGTWSLQPVPGGTTALSAIACPSTSDCWATSNSGQIITTNDGGSSWTSQTVPHGIPDLAAITCPNTSDCWAAGSNSNGGPLMLSTGNGGSNWSPQTMPSSMGSLTGVSCPSASDCFAVDGDGNIAVTTDGGTTWTLESNAPSNVGSYSAITCISTTTCWAVGNGPKISFTSDGGSVWAAQIGAPRPVTTVNAIACANADDCWYVGNGGVVATTNGGASAPPVVTALAPSGGPVSGGTEVTITGQNFTDATQVYFGKLPAQSFTVLNDTTIRAQSPSVSAPETVDVTVLTGGGTSGISTADEFIYANPAPRPTVTGVSPSSGPVSGGTEVLIFGSNLNDASEVSFGPNPATSVTVMNSAGTVVAAKAPAGTLGAVNVTVTTAGGGTSFTHSSDGFVYVEAGGYTPLSAPTRICDTRPGNQTSCSGETLSPHGTLNVAVGGVDGIPSSGVVAVVANVTVVGPTAAGYLTVFPTGVMLPSSSNLNFTAGDTVPNLVEVELGLNDEISAYNGSPGDVNVIFDVEGYVTSSSPGLYVPLTPARLADTRCSTTPQPSFCASEDLPSNNQALSAISANKSITVNVAGNAGIPSGAVAAVFNVTAVSPQGDGYLTVYPGGTPPLASNLNFVTGQTVANRVTVGLSSSGTISIFSSAETNVIVDVSGYFTDTGSGSVFTPESPVRIVDTRCSASPEPGFCLFEDLPKANAGLQPLGPSGEFTVQVAGEGNVPSTANAVVANVTVTSTTGNGYLTVYPGGTMPLVSDVNWTAGETVPNLVVGTLSSTGTLEIYNSSGSTQVIVDVMGWYSPAPSSSSSST